jgi:hypothetical protein
MIRRANGGLRARIGREAAHSAAIVLAAQSRNDGEWPGIGGIEQRRRAND